MQFLSFRLLFFLSNYTFASNLSHIILVTLFLLSQNLRICLICRPLGLCSSWLVLLSRDRFIWDDQLIDALLDFVSLGAHIIFLALISLFELICFTNCIYRRWLTHYFIVVSSVNRKWNVTLIKGIGAKSSQLTLHCISSAPSCNTAKHPISAILTLRKRISRHKISISIPISIVIIVVVPTEDCAAETS